ncbi:MAG TPA: hypothetical protein VM942_07370 [Acidimicrobiales bacterium]|nr:hypothetical protein [Acidimicrobiales bacterium]
MSPNRSREELLGDVVRRGEGLRRRRRTLVGLGSGIALLLVVAGVAAVVGSGREPATHVAAGGPATTLVPNLQANGAGGTAVAVEPTTTTTSAAVTVTTAPTRATATTAAAAPVATNPAPTPDPPDPVPDPTVPPPKQPRCSPDQMEANLTLGQTSYRQGEQVTGQAVLRNRSGAPCYYYSYSQSTVFENAVGETVAPGAALIADAFADTAFAPDQTLTASPSWDLAICINSPTCSPAPPGAYTATVTWSFDGPPIRATATFQVAP